MEWTHEEKARYGGMTAATLDRLPWLDAGQEVTPSDSGIDSLATDAVVHPPVRLREDDEMFHCEVRMPGASADSVDVTLIGTDLYVRSTGTQIDAPDAICLQSELVPSRYQRCIHLDHLVDPDQMRAVLLNGILHVTAAKRNVPNTINVEVRPTS